MFTPGIHVFSIRIHALISRIHVFLTRKPAFPIRPRAPDGEPRRVGRVGDEVESPSLLRRSRIKITA
jgi:hypothetical protein